VDPAFLTPDIVIPRAWLLPAETTAAGKGACCLLLLLLLAQREWRLSEGRNPTWPYNIIIHCWGPTCAAWL
jgi:hypothetical protein